MNKRKRQKTALITGVTGQDGSYLAELLLDKGYRVFGIQRRSSSFNTGRIDHLYGYKEQKFPNFFPIFGDLSDSSSINRIIEETEPDEIYNLGAQSHVAVSYQMPEYTANVTGLGSLRILDAIRKSGGKIKYYQASSSEMFGRVQEIPQKETTPFHPRSPYGVAKVFAYWTTKCHREAYGMFAANGILFNHESPRRGETFVTRKITRGLARIKLGLQKTVYLGNLEAKRDWGYAKNYVEAIWRILQHNKPDDFVIATGETHTVREFVEQVAGNLGYTLVWRGRGIYEKGIDKKTGRTLIAVDPLFFRPAEVDLLIGDASKAARLLGWKPEVTFKELARIMTEHDLNHVREKSKLEVKHRT